MVFLMIDMSVARLGVYQDSGVNRDQHRSVIEGSYNYDATWTGDARLPCPGGSL